MLEFGDPRTPSGAIQTLYLSLSRQEQLEAQDNLDRYLEIAKRVYDDVLSRPCGRAGLELRLEDARREEKAERDRQTALARPCSPTRPWLGSSERSHVHGG